MTDFDASNRVLPLVTALAEQRAVVRDMIAQWGEGQMTADLCVRLEVANGRVSAAMLSVLMEALRDLDLGRVVEKDLVVITEVLRRQQTYVDRTTALLNSLVEVKQEHQHSTSIQPLRGGKP